MLINNNNKGIVIALKANYFFVDIKDKSFQNSRLLCTCRARLKYLGSSICVGDSVDLEQIDFKNRTAVISAIHPRKSFISRPSVANLSDVFVIASFVEPNFDPDQITRFLIAAENTGQKVNLVLTKHDLISHQRSQEYLLRLKEWGYSPIFTSIKYENGISLLLEQIKKIKLGVFCGPSGVGKSSIINALLPHECIPIGDLSKKLNRGKHKTRHVELFYCSENALIADTPGFNKPDLPSDPKQFTFLFPEIRAQLVDQKQCKFRNCLHLDEPGCVISKNWERYSFYQKFILEMINL